ncbi:MAG: cell envelope integrity protein TolA [Pseudomonadota bacterium]
MRLSWLIYDLRHLTIWKGLARSAALHLLILTAGIWAVWPESYQIRFPIREVMFVELVPQVPGVAQVSPERPRRGLGMRAAAGSTVGRPAGLRAKGRRGGRREDVVSLAQGGSYKGYLRDIKRRIEQGWSPTSGAAEGDLMLMFSVENSGQVSRVSLLKSSGNASLDESAVSAVRTAGPFAPMPEQMGLARLHVRASFCYQLAESAPQS